ncbi:MAG: hypothetical protein IJW92_05645 [Clostridia bacterium]|nr:hypothetical protein [Clostridia bacterium]
MKLRNIRLPCRAARLILHIELPLLLLSAVIFLLSYLQQREINPAYAISYYSSTVGYLFFPAVITAFSVLLVERLEMP